MKTILITEDHAEVREPLARLLQVEGFHVLTAANGAEALTVLQNITPDLLLMDLMMPRMDGITLLQIIRHDPRWRDLPVVVLTGLVDGSLLTRARELNVSALLLKSKFKVDELFTRIRQALTAAEAAEAAAAG
jgi:chemosensory pili system protein ChpA (sensor histidine kinase/response regulator)